MKKILALMIIVLVIFTVGGCKIQVGPESKTSSANEKTDLDNDLNNLDKTDQDLNTSDLGNLDQDLDEVTW